MPQSSGPSSGPGSASAFQRHADVVWSMQRLPSSSSSQGVDAGLPGGMGTSECAACSCSSAPAAGDLQDSTVATTTPVVKVWHTGQPAPVLCRSSLGESPGAEERSLGLHCGSGGGP